MAPPHGKENAELNYFAENGGLRVAQSPVACIRWVGHSIGRLYARGVCVGWGINGLLCVGFVVGSRLSLHVAVSCVAQCLTSQRALHSIRGTRARTTHACGASATETHSLSSPPPHEAAARGLIEPLTPLQAVPALNEVRVRRGFGWAAGRAQGDTAHRSTDMIAVLLP